MQDDEPEDQPEPVRVHDKPIVETLSPRFNRDEEDDFDKPAFLRQGRKIQGSIIEDEDTPSKATGK